MVTESYLCEFNKSISKNYACISLSSLPPFIVLFIYKNVYTPVLKNIQPRNTEKFEEILQGFWE